MIWLTRKQNNTIGNVIITTIITVTLPLVVSIVFLLALDCVGLSEDESREVDEKEKKVEDKDGDKSGESEKETEGGPRGDTVGREMY